MSFQAPDTTVFILTVFIPKATCPFKLLIQQSSPRKLPVLSSSRFNSLHTESYLSFQAPDATVFTPKATCPFKLPIQHSSFRKLPVLSSSRYNSLHPESYLSFQAPDTSLHPESYLSFQAPDTTVFTPKATCPFKLLIQRSSSRKLSVFCSPKYSKRPHLEN